MPWSGLSQSDWGTEMKLEVNWSALKTALAKLFRVIVEVVGNIKLFELNGDFIGIFCH